MRSKHWGFTLVEMLVVVAILGLLATIVVINLRQNVVTGRTLGTKGQINSLKLALASYKSDLGSYPPRELMIEALTDGLGASTRWHGSYYPFEQGQLGQTDAAGNLSNRRSSPLRFYDNTNAEEVLLPPNASVYLDQFNRPMVYVPARDYRPGLAAARLGNETAFFNPRTFQLYSFGADGRSRLDGGNLILLNFDDGVDNDLDGLRDKEDNERAAKRKASANRFLEDDVANW